MPDKSPKAKMLAKQFKSCQKTIDNFLSNVAQANAGPLAAQVCLSDVTAFMSSIPEYTTKKNVGVEHTKSLSTLIDNLKDATEKELKNNVIEKLTAIKYKLAIYVVEVQAQCDAEFKQSTQRITVPMDANFNPVDSFTRFNRRYGNSIFYSSQLEETFRDISITTGGILDLSPSNQQACIGTVEQYHKYIGRYDRNKSGVYLLENLPQPKVQKGWNCGLYSAEYDMEIWYNKYHDYYYTYPAKVDGENKQDKISLKKLYRKAGIKGIGGIFDVKEFATILKLLPEDKGYHSQVVRFDSQDELQKMLVTALKNRMPITFPVDNPNNKIGLAGGAHAHYVTIVGFVEDGKNKTVFYSSYGEFYWVSLEELYKSNINLLINPAETFMKADKERGWCRFKYLPKTSGTMKSYQQNEIDLKGLRNQAVLIYPEQLRSDYENIFLALEVKSSELAIVDIGSGPGIF